MVVVLNPADVAKATELLTQSGETVFQIGRIRKQSAGEAPTIVV
jgi:phosphoribosylaminoimidazole (AIR) synthetase